MESQDPDAPVAVADGHLLGRSAIRFELGEHPQDDLSAENGTEPAPEPAKVVAGVVTFLFSDVEGSTQLLRQLHEEYPGLIARHEEVLRQTFEQHGGRVAGTQDDSVFAVFPRVGQAVAAAAEAQRALATHHWPEGVEVRVRMGLHAGEPLADQAQFVGLGVQRAARICAAAHGGQVLLSQAAASLVADHEPPDVGLRDLGECRLKDLGRPERLFQLEIRGLSSEFPPLRGEQPEREGVTGLDFKILGPLEVDQDGETLALGGKRQRAVLAFLLMEEGRVVSTDRLVDQLWGEEPPPTATTSLQNAVSRLRKVLGSDRLLTKAPGYAVRLEPDELDLARFKHLVARARELPAEPRAAMLREALELWHGPPLADFQYDSFALQEIGHLEELRASVLEDRIDADLELGRHSELVGELESLVASAPLRERLRGQLMLALYRCGRQAEALEAYQDARHTLVDALGIEPSATLQQLERSILRQDDRIAPVPASAPLADHYRELEEVLLAGRLVPVLGPRANATGLTDEGAKNGDLIAPAAQDIAAYLADRFDCPKECGRELARIGEYVAVTRGAGPLYDELHDLFDHDFEPSQVHRLIARIPSYLRDRGSPQILVVTTSYDLALERAFLEAGEEFDVVSYVAAGPHRGKFSHLPPSGEAKLIELPNAYTELVPESRPVILRIHGRVDRALGRDWESFVVSEDDHIDYLAHSGIEGLPVTLAAKLRRSHFVFLGYTPCEWPLRVFLHRVWGDERGRYRSWAVEPRPEPFARELWRHLSVDLLDIPMAEYLDELEGRISADREVVPA